MNNGQRQQFINLFVYALTMKIEEKGSQKHPTDDKVKSNAIQQWHTWYTHTKIAWLCTEIHMGEYCSMASTYKRNTRSVSMIQTHMR